jgi:hypothetical protein
MKSIILIIACSSLFSPGFSQSVEKKNKPGIRFSSVNQLGLLNGSYGASYDLQTINGVALKTWSVGVGVGFDNYINRSIPLFIDMRKEFGTKSKVPFIYADGGLNYTWLTQVQKEQKGLPYATTPGLYWDAGLGLKLKSKSNVAVLLSVGFSYKQSKETVQPSYWMMPWPLPGQSERDFTERLNSQFRRIVVRLGIQI